MATHRGAINVGASVEELEQIVEVIPSEWLAPSATGTPQQCAQAVQYQLDLGCGSVIMHSATPAELAPAVVASRGRRPEAS